MLPTDAEMDARIDAAIRRLFPPPAIWPSLFNGTETHDQPTRDHEIANGQVERRIDEPTGSEPETHRIGKAVESAHAGRGRRAMWMRRLGVAACLMLGLFGVWNIWNHVSSMLPRSYQAQPVVEVGHMYRQFVDNGFQPTSDCAVDASGRWIVPDTPMTVQLTDADALGLGIELLGTSRRDDVQVASPMLLLHVNGEPVVLFAGSASHWYAATSACSEHLHLHHRRVAQFNVYELSPHASPAVLSHIACDGPDCESEPHPQCAIEITQ